MSNILVQNIKHTNGTTAQTIDSTGRVLTPARPAFRARLDGPSSNATGSQGTLVFNNEDFDIGGNYNTSDGLFTAPIGGIYQFMFRALAATDSSGTINSAGDTFYADFYKNGTDNANIVPGARELHQQAGGNFYVSVSMTSLIQLSASDNIRVIVGSEFVYADATDAYDPCFEGFLIG
tara:strand:- start:33 stop:566 length:534 start_codon:yes stop_codon:yes gene_type:complete